MAQKPTYEELEQSVKELEKEAVERKRAEKALRESEERYKALFQGAAEGMLVADIETKEFKYANPALCKMLGYSEEELKRMSVVDIHPKEALGLVISEFEAQAQGEKTLAQDIPCLRKDGTTIYADINTTKALIDGRGCNVGFFTEITERKRAEEALRKAHDELETRVEERTAELIKANEKLKREIKDRKRTKEALKDSELQKGAILDACVDMIMQYDTDLRILWANTTAAAFVNKTPQDLVGHKCHKIFQGLDSPCPGCPCVKVLETGNSENSTMYHAEMDTVGESYWHNYAVPIKDESGKVVTIIEIARNVTEQKQAEEALRESEEKYRTQFEEALDAIFVSDAETGILVDCNHAASVLVGRTKSEIVGKHQSILYPPEEVEGEFSRTFKQNLEEKKVRHWKPRLLPKMEK